MENFIKHASAFALVINIFLLPCAAYASCVNNQPIYKLEVEGALPSFLMGSVHMLPSNFQECIFPSRFYSVINRVKTVYLERMEMGSTPDAIELQSELELMYPGIDPDLGMHLLSESRNLVYAKEIMDAALADLEAKKALAVRSDPVADLISRWAVARYGDAAKRELKTLSLLSRPALLRFISFLPLLSKTKVVLVPGHDLVIMSMAKSRMQMVRFLEKPKDVLSRYAEAFPDDASYLKALKAAMNIAKDSSAYSVVIDEVKQYIELGRILPSNTEYSNNFSLSVLPVMKAREKYWVPMIADLVHSKECPCFFVVGADHLEKSMFREQIGRKVIIATVRHDGNGDNSVSGNK